MQAVGDTAERAKQIDWNSQLSIRRQCELLKIHRSILYYQRKDESAINQRLMGLIDKYHLEDPSAGTRRMSKYLRRATGMRIGRKRVRRLMRRMGIEAIYPRKRTTIPGSSTQIYPYLLRKLPITRPNQVWAADITYVPMRKGFVYLFAIIDWYSRKIIDWEISTTLDTEFCLRCLNRAILKHGPPEIFNTDQGCQFTSGKWTSALKEHGIAISMDGKGRWIDNVMIERFWRTIKYEDIYLKSYENPRELAKGITSYIQRYNGVRPHESLSDATPDEIYYKQQRKAA